MTNFSNYYNRYLQGYLPSQQSRDGYIPPNTPEAYNLPQPTPTTYGQGEPHVTADTAEQQAEASPEYQFWLLMQQMQQQQPQQPQQPFTIPTLPGNNGTSYYGGGGGGGIQGREQAQAILNEYVAMLQNGDPAMGGLQSALDEWRSSITGQLGAMRANEVEALNAMRHRGRRQIRRNTRAARRGARNAYSDLYQFLRDPGQRATPYDNLNATRAAEGRTSDALLADQGAGNAAVMAEAVRAARDERRGNSAYEQYVELMQRNARDANQSRMRNARADYADARAGIAGGRAEAMDELVNNYMTARQGIRSNYGAQRLNFLNQFGQQNFQLAGQQAASSQQIRDAIMQIALQYGLDLPPYLFLMGGGQGG
jgi:hypothetical protein